MFTDKTSYTEKQDADAKAQVCLNYAKALPKIRTVDMAEKLLGKGPETPAKPAKEKDSVMSLPLKKTAKEVADEFDAEDADDDVSLERKSVRGMWSRFFDCSRVLTRFSF